MQLDSKRPEIDEGLYSRQLYVLGHEAMHRMASSNVLIVGLKGLGIEIAKNVCLAGVKSITLYDPNPVQIQDLSTQFFLREADLNKPRADVSAQRLAELNQYVPISVLDGELSADKISDFQVVVLTETPMETQLAINDYTHTHGIYFISTDVRGLFGNVFCDFGPKFSVVDTNGENPVGGIIADINDDGLVTALDETRHGLEDGEYVTFTEVKGMEAINGAEPRKVEVKGPYTFSIGSVAGLGKYQSGGLFLQIKMPKILEFKSLRDSLTCPEYLISDYAKFDRPPQLHVGFQALHAFSSENAAALPRPANEADAEIVLQHARKIATTCGVDELDESLVTKLAYQARGDLSPMTALFGGIAAQELLKACSGKFTPVVQHLYFDSLESLPSTPPTEAACEAQGSRYDGQIAVFGKEFQDKISNLQEFLVGAGAIGCEMLKNWAMMGLGVGSKGFLHVTDMDSIEKSNLNRQFLFRPSDVTKLKSECAASAVKQMNPQLSGHIKAYSERVGPDTEQLFNDDFWQRLDAVTNALDNVDARTYVDRRCVFFRKPLLESGTLGTKGNTQVVLPYRTESYSSSQDPPEKSFPICTLRNFPNQIEHTIAWGRDLFEGYFKQPAENVNLFLSQPNFLESTLKQASNQKEMLQTIQTYLGTERPLSFEQCIVWARHEFEKNFHNEIAQLLYNFPKDSTTSSGTPFWSGPKRAPNPLAFSTSNTEHLAFVVAAANLHAFNYGLKGPNDMSKYREVLDNIIVPEFIPRSGVKIQANENEPDPNANDAAGANIEGDELTALAESLPQPSTLAGFRLTPVEFEKDDDANYHMDFITAASNLRAMNYSIQTADKHKTKFVAGKIIPAIATTTALVTGLVCLELYKLIDGKEKLEDYKNSFVNLALPFISSSEPIASSKGKYNGVSFDMIWDRFDYEHDLTLQELLEDFEKKGLTITMLSAGVSLLYGSFYSAKKVAERKPMPISKLVETISKKPVPAYQKTLILELCADDKNGELGEAFAR